MISGLVKPGDKIDIVSIHQNNGKTYKSSVFDIISETELEISMPTESGKMILFQVGYSYQFYFYTQKGMYTCEAVVKNRGKRDNFYLLVIKITTVPKKYQRRDFYRVNCMVDFCYYHIDKEVADMETTEDLFEEIANPDYIDKKRVAVTKDISGGGVRFVVDEDIEPGSYVLLVLHLANEKVDHTFYLVTEMIACDKMEKMPGKKVARGRFLYKEQKDRDLVVRYVFEEDRMLRKKENG